MAPLRFQHARHPHCPECGYDLVATVEAERTVCPECGETFEPQDLMRAPRAGDWTVTRGLRTGARMVLVRSLVTGLAWLLLIWGVPTIFGHLAGGIPAGFRLGLIVLGGFAMGLAGGVIGWAIARDWEECAGFGGQLSALGLIGMELARDRVRRGARRADRRDRPPGGLHARLHREHRLGLADRPPRAARRVKRTGSRRL